MKMVVNLLIVDVTSLNLSLLGIFPGVIHRDCDSGRIVFNFYNRFPFLFNRCTSNVGIEFTAVGIKLSFFQ